MSSITITLDSPIDGLVLGYALDEGIKRYADSITFWESDERTMSPEGRATVIATLQDDKRRLENIKRDISAKLEATRRRNAGGVR